MALFRNMLLSTACVLLYAAALSGSTQSADSSSTFFFPDGKTKVGILERMVSDTLVIRIQGANGKPLEKRLHKSACTKVVLPGGAQLDLSTSRWPAATGEDWTDVASSVSTTPVGSISISTGSVTATVYIDSLVAGTSPLKRDSIPAGTHALRVIAPGYKVVDEAVLITAQQVLAHEVILEHTQVWKDSVKAFDDSAKVARAKAYADSIRAASEARIAAALKSANSIDNLEGMMGALLARVVLDTATPQSMAVLPFTVAPGVAPQAGIMAAEYAVVNLAARKEINIVERTGFEKMMQELDLSQSDLVPESKTLAAGKILAARYLVLGTVTEDLGKRLVTVRIVETETGAVVSAAAASIKIRDMDTFTHDALGEKVDPSSALFRSAVLPGWGQFYTGHPGQGVAALACMVGGVGVLIWSAVDWSGKRTEADRFRRIDPATFVDGETPDEYLVRGNAKIDAQNDAATRDIAIGAVLAGVWIANMVDALLCGVNESRHVRARYFSVVPTFDGRAAGCVLTMQINRSTRSN